MAAIVTKYSVGNQVRQFRGLGDNQAKRISDAFRISTLAGAPLGSMPMGLGQTGSWWKDLIGQGVDIVGSRWGQQRGSITQLPDGTIIQKQAAGVPIATSPPVFTGAQVQAPEGFATGLASGTVVAMVVGGVFLVLLMGRRR